MFRRVLLASLILASPAYAQQPDGCYQLGALVPKAFDAASGHHIVPIDRDLCVESKNVQPEKAGIQAGEFTVRIRKGTATLVTYSAKAMLVDASGSHYDFVFGSETVLRKIGNADAYARGNRGPIENTIFFIVPNEDRIGAIKRKTGANIGSVTIGGLRYALLVK
jgi:hypothetical protein